RTHLSEPASSAPTPTSPSPYLLHVDNPAPPPLHTLSLHDALPISQIPANWLLASSNPRLQSSIPTARLPQRKLLSSTILRRNRGDRKSTRLNSSHVAMSYAVFCLKKKI